MFSAFRAVFLRSLPYRDPDRIVVIEKTGQHGITPAMTAAAVLIAGALVAYYLPAWRSTRIDPAQLLRQE